QYNIGVLGPALPSTITLPRNSDWIFPASHQAGSDPSPYVPSMGQRFRLRADFDISSFSPTNQVILTALKQYGMIVADNGSNWFLSGAPDPRWDDSDLHQLSR